MRHILNICDNILHISSHKLYSDKIYKLKEKKKIYKLDAAVIQSSNKNPGVTHCLVPFWWLSSPSS